MPNQRIFYACQAVAIEAPQAGGTVEVAHGVQSVGVTTNFSLEQAFELGQIQIYENIEGVPDIEVTLEKVLDGYPLLFFLATRGAGLSATLVERSKLRCNVGLGIFDDGVDVVGTDGAGGTQNANAEVIASGMYMSSVAYNINTDGNHTESISLVGNQKTWNSSPVLVTQARVQAAFHEGGGPSNVGGDIPHNNKAGQLHGGIQRRENVNWAASILPASIIRAIDPLHKAVTDVAYNPAVNNNTDSGGKPIAHVQSISISTDFSREDINELGRKAPYYRSPNFPIEVTCDIEVLSTDGDWVQAFEEGYLTGVNAGNNTPEETITITLDDGTKFELGAKNRLSSVSYGGGDAGGGNATMTFSYSTFNDLTVTSPTQ